MHWKLLKIIKKKKKNFENLRQNRVYMERKNEIAKTMQNGKRREIRMEILLKHVKKEKQNFKI